MIFDLPKQLEVDGVLHNIRSDFRAVLDINIALNDENLSTEEKICVMLEILYEDIENINNIEEAFEKAKWFISYGNDKEETMPKPILMNWEQDFVPIVSAVNRVLGYDCRAVEYLHWWTFISAYYEIGECSFSSIVNIRYKKKKGKKLEKYEEEFYRENKDVIDIKVKPTQTEQALLDLF